MFCFTIPRHFALCGTKVKLKLSSKSLLGSVLEKVDTKILYAAKSTRMWWNGISTARRLCSFYFFLSFFFIIELLKRNKKKKRRIVYVEHGTRQRQQPEHLIGVEKFLCAAFFGMNFPLAYFFLQLAVVPLLELLLHHPPRACVHKKYQTNSTLFPLPIFFLHHRHHYQSMKKKELKKENRLVFCVCLSPSPFNIIFRFSFFGGREFSFSLRNKKHGKSLSEG